MSRGYTINGFRDGFKSDKDKNYGINVRKDLKKFSDLSWYILLNQIEIKVWLIL